MTEVAGLVPPSPAAELAGEGLRRWLEQRYELPGPRWLRLNLVTALSGRITGPGGTSDDLTGGIDRVLLGVLRRSADAVLIGAGSVRAERLALPRTAQLAIATRSGALRPQDVPEPRDGRRAVVLCPAAEAGHLAERLGSRARVLAVPDDAAEQPAHLVDALAAEGLTRVVCEGGGTLAGALLAAGLVDEFDQTLAPVVVSPGAPSVSGPVPPMPASLAGLLRDGTDRLYARWSLRPR